MLYVPQEKPTFKAEKVWETRLHSQSASVSPAEVMSQRWACTCLGPARTYQTNLLSMNPACTNPVWFFRRYHLFVYTSWKWFVSSRQSRWLSCVPPHAVKMSSCLTLNVDGPRQGFNQSFLAEESATQHPLTTQINDQAAFHQLLTFSLILFMCVLLEAHFSEMSFVCDSGHVFMCVCIRLYVCVCVFVCHALSRQSIHPLWLTPRVSCCLRRLINDPFA